MNIKYLMNYCRASLRNRRLHMSATATRNVKIGSPPSDLRMLLAAQVVSCKQNKTMDQLQGGFDRSTSDSDIESLLLLSTKKKAVAESSTLKYL